MPDGDFQIESDLFNWSRATAPGVRTDTYLVTNPTFKYGVGSATDIEANIVPYEQIVTHVGGQSTSIGGVGDLYLRVKQRLTDASGKAQLSLIPYVKVPTARSGIGDRQWEGGRHRAVQLQPAKQHHADGRTRGGHPRQRHRPA